MKLNLMCGYDRKLGYLNLDISEQSNADIIADITQMDFAPGEISEVIIKHGIEHLSRRDAEALVQKAAQWLTPDGKLIIITPDFDSNAKEYLKATTDKKIQHWNCVLFGTQQNDYEFHKSIYSQETLTSILKHYGFNKVSSEVSYNDARDQFELRVEASKSTRPFVHIGIPTYQSPQECFQLVKSIEAHTVDYDIHIIVDSPSYDYSMLSGIELPHINKVFHNENKGLTKTWNELLLMHEPTDWICLINDDVKVLDGWLEALTDAVDDKTGIVGFEQWYEPHQHWCNYWVGSCMLLNPQALREVGIFDETFRLHAQDYDMFWRMEMAGWKVKAIQPCLIEHKANTAINKVANASSIISEDNQMLILKYKSMRHRINSISEFDIDWGEETPKRWKVEQLEGIA